MRKILLKQTAMTVAGMVAVVGLATCTAQVASAETVGRNFPPVVDCGSNASDWVGHFKGSSGPITAWVNISENQDHTVKVEARYSTLIGGSYSASPNQPVRVGRVHGGGTWKIAWQTGDWPIYANTGVLDNLSCSPESRNIDQFNAALATFPADPISIPLTRTR